MITYTVITLALVSLGVLTFVPKYQPVIAKYNVGINFFLTLLATLVGVLLAMALADYEEQAKEKRNFIKMLNATKASVSNTYAYTDSIRKYANQLNLSEDAKEQFFKDNPPPYPDYLDTFLMQNITSRNLSEEGLTELNEIKINLQKSQSNNPKVYLSILQYAQTALALEIQYQRGDIDIIKLDEKLDKLAEELRNQKLEQVKEVE